jgi:N-acetylmuramoyl-L-alanine amidase
MKRPLSRRTLLVGAVLHPLLGAGPASASLSGIAVDGKLYVELARLAATLGTKVDTTTAARVRLRVGPRAVTFTRDWAQILVDGAPVVLDAPVRVREGAWLVPASFVSQVLPRLVARAPTVASPRPPAEEITLDELRYRSYPSFTRVVVEASAPVGFNVEASGPREARVRIAGLAAPPRREELRDGFVEEIRVERAGADTLIRVVYEAAAGTVRTSTLTDPPRVVLDFARPTEPAPGQGGAALTPLTTIVLDAGHGGHDSGAVGPGGLLEKELVLDVTRRVAKLVEGPLGVKVLLTRSGDYFVPLKDRTSYANKERADLFVSIHANAHPHRATDGVETFFLSSEATDSEARQVAALENGTVHLERPNGGRGGRLDIVRTILWDLAQSEFQHESSRLAEIVQDSITRSLRIPNRGVKQAGFYVLGGAAMPAVLVEIGFVTNPQEERRLKSAPYRDGVARAIAAGLAEYKRFWDRRARMSRESRRH